MIHVAWVQRMGQQDGAAARRLLDEALVLAADRPLADAVRAHLADLALDEQGPAASELYGDHRRLGGDRPQVWQWAQPRSAALIVLPLIGFLCRIRVEEAALSATLGTAWSMPAPVSASCRLSGERWVGCHTVADPGATTGGSR